MSAEEEGGIGWRWRGQELVAVPGVLVPGHLGPEENLLLDQPPFSWLVNDDRVFEAEMISPQGRLLFVRAVVFVGRWERVLRASSGRPLGAKDQHLQVVLPEVTEGYRYKDTLIYAANQVRAFLGQYPYSHDYLQRRWKKSGGFGKYGKRLATAEWREAEVATYAAYAYQRLREEWLNSDEGERLEVLPARPSSGMYQVFCFE